MLSLLHCDSKLIIFGKQLIAQLKKTIDNEANPQSQPCRWQSLLPPALIICVIHWGEMQKPSELIVKLVDSHLVYQKHYLLTNPDGKCSFWESRRVGARLFHIAQRWICIMFPCQFLHFFFAIFNFHSSLSLFLLRRGWRPKGWEKLGLRMGKPRVGKVNV